MSHHLLYINYLGVEIDLHYKSKIVAADVEDGTSSDTVGVGVNSFNLNQVRPACPGGNFMPRFQKFA
jgi:hypothetical protein